jgi:hypothetical protein
VLEGGRRWIGARGSAYIEGYIEGSVQVKLPSKKVTLNAPCSSNFDELSGAAIDALNEL